MLWLKWDLAKYHREFFSYQGLIFLYLVLFCAVILAIILLFLEFRLVRPLYRLESAIEGLKFGWNGEELERELMRRDQIGELARAFVEMRRELKRREEERENYIETLQSINEELQRANRAIKRAQEELIQKEKLATVGFLAAGVAHEIGNPLSAIIGYSELIAESVSCSEGERELAGRILSEAKRIDRIIRELLDYSKPIARGSKADPVKIVEVALDLLKPQKKFRGMEIEKNCGGELPEAQIEPDHLLQVLINILSNAADACGGEGKIMIECRKAFSDGGEWLLIAIDDSGPGVPEELREKVFEPFFSTKAPGDGVGLGLAICRRIIVEAGGKLELKESELGGARFELLLPLA